MSSRGWFLLGCALAACDGPSDASTEDSGIDSSTADGGHAGTDAMPPDLPPRTLELGLAMLEARAPGHNIRVDIGDADEACTLERVAGCDIETCPMDVPPDPDVGVVTVTSGERTATLTPESGAYAEVSGGEPFFVAGAPVRFQATGGTWSGFDETLIAPGDVLPTDPTPLAVARDAPLELHFDAAGDHSVVAAVAYYVASTGESVAVRCFARAEDGAVTVPAAVLARIPDGVDPRLLVFGEDRVVMRDDPREMRLLVRSELRMIDASFFEP